MKNSPIDKQLKKIHDDFFKEFRKNAKPGSSHLLVAAAGSGKTTAVVKSITELMVSGNMKRVLVVAPMMALCEQFRQVFKENGQSSTLISAQTQRIFLERYGVSYTDFPKGVFVVGAQSAVTANISSLIMATHWDLVVFDEAQHVKGKLLELYNGLMEKDIAPAVLFMAATGVLLPQLPNFELRVYDWSSAIQGLLQQKNSAGLGQTVLTEQYTTSASEADLLDRVYQASRSLDCEKGISLLQRTSSSIVALDNTLEVLLDGNKQSNEMTELIEGLMDSSEKLTKDSRLDCFLSLVTRKVADGHRCIVVFCEYKDTASYLLAALEDNDLNAFEFSATLTEEARAQILQTHNTSGGILVATTSSLIGVSLAYVEIVIHYDLPASSAVYRVRESRYLGVERNRPVSVFFLEDIANGFALNTLRLGRFRDKTSSWREEDISFCDMLDSIESSIQK